MLFFNQLVNFACDAIQVCVWSRIRWIPSHLLAEINAVLRTRPSTRQSLPTNGDGMEGYNRKCVNMALEARYPDGIYYETVYQYSSSPVTLTTLWFNY